MLSVLCGPRAFPTPLVVLSVIAASKVYAKPYYKAITLGVTTVFVHGSLRSYMSR